MTITTGKATIQGMAARERPSRSPFREALRELVRNRTALIGLAMIAAWIVVALLVSFVVPFDPLKTDVAHRLAPPSAQAWFGTDELGRNIFKRVLYGARLSIPAGILTVLGAAIIGCVLGAIAGYAGGWVDQGIMRLSDMVLAFPSIVLAMAIATALGPGLKNALIAIVAVLWPEYARVMRGQVLSLKENEYVTAAVSVGARQSRILVRHVLPNTDAPIIVKATLDIGAAIVLTAGLSFIGLGAVPPQPEWGAMIRQGQRVFNDWWVATFPGLAIFSVVMALNFVGDGLRDALDPRLRGRR